MRRVAIVGAGQAGSLLAVGLRRQGYDVTLYSDRPALGMRDDVPPTGTAAIFAEAIEVERRLGVETYEDRFVPTDAVHLFFCPKIGTELVHFGAPLEEASAAAVDVRLKSYDRMVLLEQLGGKLVVQTVSLDDLDAIAADHDLTFVSTGKGGLADLFPRDGVRSVYDRPQRNLAMLVVRGIPTDGTAFPHRVPGHTPVCFNLFGGAGEMFWVPYLHKTEGRCWNIVFEPREGSPFDRFGETRSLEERFEMARRTVKEFTPWDWDTMKDMEPVPGDPFASVVGRVTPTVRAPAGTTRSGHLVMSLGDTSVAYDPVGGQGAGSGTRQAGYYCDAIVERADRAFDRQWIERTFEGFWSWHASGAYRFNNVLLEPLDATGIKVMKACFASPKT
ncbi:MAG: hypothetical protein QOI86_5567, partial [Actinomycetota bacterium]|nr:hypothetical protein [Actinomycetota bacterium]